MAHTFPVKLSAFAYVPWIKLQSLEEKARKECWGEDLTILRSYISNTYSFLAEKEPEKLLVVMEGRYVVFNTGLYTHHFQAIYGIFSRSDHKINETAGNAQWAPYLLKSWVTERELADPRAEPTVAKDELPSRAEYIQDYNDAVYNPSISIVEPNLDHIFAEDAKHNRFKIAMQQEGLQYDDRTKRMFLQGAIETA